MAASAPRPILHGSNISPYVRKVRVALAYKGIEYDDVQQIPFGAPPEYVAKSPLSKIPCWEEGELILPDSSVILSYLEHRYPDPPLLPAAPGPRARALWFEEYADTKVSVTLAGVFFERVVKPNFFKQETNQAVIDRALKQERVRESAKAVVKRGGNRCCVGAGCWVSCSSWVSFPRLSRRWSWRRAPTSETARTTERSPGSASRRRS